MLSDLLPGLLHGTLARPRCIGNQIKPCPWEVVTVVMDARIVIFLNVLRELKAVAMTPTVVTTSLCKEACRSEISQGVGMICNQCGCHMIEVLELE